jgi:hypothetical protein
VSEAGPTHGEPVAVPAPELGAVPAAPAAPLTGLFSGFGNAAMARMLQRQPAAVASEPDPPGPTASQTWQHPEVRSKAEAIEKPPEAPPKPSDRGLQMCLELVPAVVRAVKGYSSKDGKQVPLENAMLIISEAANEHAPYDPGRLNQPVIPPGNMMWGVTSASDTPGATVKTTTDEEVGGVRHSESGRKFRAYDTLDDAAKGYLQALEGVDPDAAKNPAFPKVLEALQTPGMTPEKFGATLDSVGYATAKNYGKDIAAHTPQTKAMVQKFMPQILSSLGGKIADIEAKQLAYHELVGWIDTRIESIQTSLSSTGVLTDEGQAKLQEELNQLTADRETALAAIEKLNPEIEKAKQLMADVAEFGTTLGPAPKAG